MLSSSQSAQASVDKDDIDLQVFCEATGVIDTLSLSISVYLWPPYKRKMIAWAKVRSLQNCAPLVLPAFTSANSFLEQFVQCCTQSNNREYSLPAKKNRVVLSLTVEGIHIWIFPPIDGEKRVWVNEFLMILNECWNPCWSHWGQGGLETSDYMLGTFRAHVHLSHNVTGG